MRSVLLIASLASIAGCATLDNSRDRYALDAAADTPSRGPVERLAVDAAHGPATRVSDGWVVTVTPQELAALGFGQQMELDVQAPGVVYVVDYQRIGQLDGVFARTAGGLLPLRALLKDEYEAGRVVLRTPEPTPPTPQPTDADCGA